jgi:exodeoxyribonuclease V beta subunit
MSNSIGNGSAQPADALAPTPAFNFVSTHIRDGQLLVEASAGTGKTFALTGVVVRLVLEGVDLRKILVVTFTNAATDELKTRIRKRLRETLSLFESNPEPSAPDDKDGFFAAFGADENSVVRLRKALLDVDEASVFTIHGFCQRVLQQSAFESGAPFEPEFVENADDLLERAVADFLSRRTYADSLAASIAARLGDGELHAHYKAFFRYPSAVLEPDVPTYDVAREQLLARLQAVAAEWPSQRAEIVEVIKATTWNKDSGLDDANLPALLAHLDTHLDASPLDCMKEVHRLSRGHLLGFAHKSRSKTQRAIYEQQAFSGLCQQVSDAVNTLELAFIRTFLEEVSDRFDALKQSAGVLTFDDLLVGVDRALAEDSPTRQALLDAIRSRWTHALIDEFQDTDPLQYRIFRTAFEGRPLVFVGDPKQAIYSFRGADLYAYLEAKRDTEKESDELSQRYMLDRNWRSDPKLVEAVNAVFRRPAAPFLIEGVPFEEVTAAEKDDAPKLESDDLPPLVWWTRSAPDGEKHIKKGGLSATIVDGVASGIRELLASSATIEGKPVSPSNIAVLVRTNKEAAAMQEALAEAGIPAVVGRSGDVWSSPEVTEIEHLLRAFLRPADRTSLCTALATAMWGKTAADIHEIRNDENLTEEVRSRLSGYQQTWRSRGVLHALTQFIEDQSVARRFLRLTDGERRLTNIRHALELLHEEEGRHGRGPDELVSWLRSRESRNGGDRETSELRLESDEAAVQIVTMHKSKGLQYDIVIAPFLWSGREARKRGKCVVVHDGDRIVYDIGSAQEARRRAISDAEQLSEDLRLAYVSMTRAVHRCYVVWAEANFAGRSALGYLLKGFEGVNADDDISARAQEAFATATEVKSVTSALNALVDANPELMAAYDLPSDAPAFVSGTLPAKTFSPRTLSDATLPKLTPWAVRSYSQLVSGETHEPAFSFENVAREGFFAFAAGRVPGNLLHEIIEEVDIASLPRIGKGDVREVEDLVRRKLRAFGLDDPAKHRGGDDFDPQREVMRFLGRLGRTRIPLADVTLPELDSQRTLREWGFTVPVGAITPDSLAGTLLKHGEGRLRDDYSKRIRGLRQDALNGYLTGIADFAFEHDDRWYVFDWKSTNLGHRLEDYAPERLEEAALDRHYALQLLLYTLGLHRYLQTRMRDYDYSRHVGGAGVVFLRGVDGRTSNGFYVVRPPAELILAMEDMLAPIPA